MSNAVILINGFPGVGKSSVARELMALLPHSTLLEAQALDLAANAAHEVTSRSNAELRKRLRETILRSLAPVGTGVGAQSRIMVITDTLLSSPPTSAFLQSYLACCRSNGIILIHIILSCDSSTNVSRLGSGSKIDEDTLVAMRMEEEIGQYLSLQDKVRGGSMPGLSGEMELDNSNLGAKDTAARVGEYCIDLLKRQGWSLQPAKRV
ncbi:hypothetical protein BD324DRAFT_54721 [Kockovaella imperatae]|uniref:AAA domain-domain-containing protein n=1 Tax=Kockovaella imperatae TaxID=4999 RepID=A0A1Y1UUY7_9TREE|nr:hypothetical protein BD324DRAFT_54721 [Kockovaella imperatae]ORX41286.1 hypothetical protein BD324DRAFT_54721 [Kockovaella imperatae]